MSILLARRIAFRPSSLLRIRQSLSTTADFPATEEPASSELPSSPPRRSKKTVYTRRVPIRGLIGKISALGRTDGRVEDVLRGYIRDGMHFSKDDLISCLKTLRKVGRYQHCYEILQWLEKSKYTYSVGDYALHLDIVCKVQGVAEAEKYFNRLPAEAKAPPAYGALLNCYCKKSMADKAAAFFEEMIKLKVAFPLSFNNLMGMFIRLGQPEKVPPLIQVMKDMNHPVNNFSRILLMQAYLSVNDIEGVERVFHEIKENENVDWPSYSNLAHAYIRTGFSDKAELALKELEELVKNKKNERVAYHYLISLYASTGNSVAVFRVWDLLKSYYPLCINSSYSCFLQAIVKLDKVVDMKNVFQEWSTSCQNYDPRIPIIVIRAYLSWDLHNEAEQVFETARCRTGSPLFVGREFIDYYLSKGDTDSALRHMEMGVAHAEKDQQWQLQTKTVASFFKHFEKEKDADGAERLFLLLKKAGCLDSHKYLLLLQTYVRAGKTDLEMRKKMEEDGIEISSELENLLDKVCPR